MTIMPDTLSFLDAALLVGVSFFTSFLSASMGIGGGVALLAVMAQVMPALAIVPVHGVVQLGSNAGRAYLMREAIVWRIVLYFLMGSLIGGLIGGQIVVALPAATLQLVLGLFVLYSLWGPMPKPSADHKSMAFVGSSGALSTLLTMFVGATGPFVAVVVKMFSLSRLAHVGTFSACMVGQHTVKIVVFGVLGFAFGAYLPLMVAMVATGFLGTWVGRHFLVKSTDERFGRWLNIILTLLAARLLWQGAQGFFA
ncbi:sulfite exporter TauE/SafE family protein [Kordiimonas lipolytica]|uniref:Probable membrane transporter protein n=1 Tax=Kordiimonas lipolytica TaxID=1662421 RepID=A0ABV8U754_9PROT|nr:sulfite exporter TauE/SafE family protein [Kordiimonas lipolytica]